MTYDNQSNSAPLDDAEGERLMRRILWRVVPFIFICYVISYLDRTNVGFAAISMNKDLGLTATMFGWAAGLFFFGYFIFEIPSNLLMQRFGARIWIARIMITWGLISMATVRYRPNQLQHCTLPAGGCRGRIHPRGLSVLHLLVPG
ncbi:MFS transporter [Pseudomonas sp. R3-18-08]|uniref:MFS transporter n=1 Tax=Pseudomonas sp. R3-18-08 TaxID=1173283 RepID=UPI000F6D90AE|nr:Nitrate/nitrite transporter [Pseudomonas sp. R3-18-08]